MLGPPLHWSPLNSHIVCIITQDANGTTGRFSVMKIILLRWENLKHQEYMPSEGSLFHFLEARSAG